MGFPISQLITQATNARNGYVAGQDEGRENSIKAALLKQQQDRQTREDALKDAFMKAQTSKLLQQPAPPRDYVKEHELNRDYDNAHPSAATTPAPDLPARLQKRISELTAGGMKLDAASKQARQEYGQTEPAAPQASFSFPTVTGPNGEQVIASANTRTGEVRPTDIGAKAGQSMQKLTEPQEKSHLFYNLMKNAEPEISAAMTSGKIRPQAVSAYLASEDASSIPFLGKLLGGVLKPVANQQLNAEEQQLLRAGKDFTAGVLRKESGAAVTPQELIQTMERYFPGMFGDKPQLTEAKRLARQQYMETMRQQAQPALDFYAKRDHAAPAGGATSEAEWAAKHPAQRGESFEAYHARYLQSRGGD